MTSVLVGKSLEEVKRLQETEKTNSLCSLTRRCCRLLRSRSTSSSSSFSLLPVTWSFSWASSLSSASSSGWSWDHRAWREACWVCLPCSSSCRLCKTKNNQSPSQQESEHSTMLDSFCLLWACCGVVGGLWRVCLGDGCPLRSVCSLRGPATAAGSAGFHGTPVWRQEISS